MGESLIISETMDLNELAYRMGGTTIEEAEQMRHILCRSAYNGLTILDVPAADWLKMLEVAAKDWR